ncbi:viscerotropic leishmaniasis antigen, putative, partial [Leishmania tarentolae]
MTHTSPIRSRRCRCAMLTTAAVTNISLLLLLLFSALLFEGVLPARNLMAVTRMAHAATEAAPPRCHVDQSRYTGKATSTGSWAGLRFSVVFALDLCSSDPDNGDMSVQLNEQHVNVTGRSGVVVMPHLGIVRFNLSAPAIGPQFFSSELCYSEVDCTNLCAHALIGHIGSCTVAPAVTHAIIFLFFVAPPLACIGVLAALYLRKRTQERQLALDRLPTVCAASPDVVQHSPSTQPVPSTPPSLSSSYVVLADSSEPPHSRSRVTHHEHDSPESVVITVSISEENLSPLSRCTTQLPTTSDDVQDMTVVPPPALSAVSPYFTTRPFPKQHPTHTFDRYGETRPPTTTVAVHKRLFTTDFSTGTSLNIPHFSSPHTSASASHLLEEAARLEAEHEAEQSRIRLLEEAARLE